MPSGLGLSRAAGKAATAAVFALAIVGKSAAAVDFDGSSYARNVSLSANVDIFWTIDTAGETIRVAVHAKAATGWASVGISEMGGMEGADMVFYETAVSYWHTGYFIGPAARSTAVAIERYAFRRLECQRSSSSVGKGGGYVFK